jgi:hypothetical protein
LKSQKTPENIKVRFILIAVSLVNIILYYTAYAYFDNILAALAGFELPVGFLTFLKYFIVFILGFLIGFLIIIGMKLRVRMNYFDIKVLLLVGFIPASAMILYYTGIVDLILNKIAGPGGSAGELYYYFFSRTDIWSLWLGTAVGSSIRVKLAPAKKYRHQAIE